MNTVGYAKYKKYIFTIKSLEDLMFFTENNENKNFATYFSNKFKLLDIEDMVTNIKLNKIDNYKTDNIFPDMFYYKNKEQAFYHNFFRNKQYLLFPNGYSGYYKKYSYDGYIESECFYINNNKEGQKIIYVYNTKNIHKIENYVNNIKHGEFITYSYINPNKMVMKTIYNNNKVISHQLFKDIEEIEYNYDENI
jgi:antitoxin component YwqK of YwqJK toxin-antitoxin module